MKQTIELDPETKQIIDNLVRKGEGIIKELTQKSEAIVNDLTLKTERIMGEVISSMERMSKAVEKLVDAIEEVDEHLDGNEDIARNAKVTITEEFVDVILPRD